MKRSLALALTIGILATSAAALGGPPPAAASTVPACTARQLSARIVDWTGAMGSNIADVVLVNTSFTKCSLRDLPRVQLVGSNGALLIVGVPASATAPTHGLNPLAFVKTEVSDGNYCGPAYKKPVTLAFLLPSTGGRVVVMPLSPTDSSGVPPCNGAPGPAGHVSMHAWHT